MVTAVCAQKAREQVRFKNCCRHASVVETIPTSSFRSNLRQTSPTTLERTHTKRFPNIHPTKNAFSAEIHSPCSVFNIKVDSAFHQSWFTILPYPISQSMPTHHYF